MAFAPRFLRTPGSIALAGRRIKRYHVCVDDRAIEPAIVEAAYAMVPSLLSREHDGTPPAAFVVLHRGRDAAFCVVYSWVWDNVLECHSAAAGSRVLGCADDDPTHFVMVSKPWIGCVWELPAVAHERTAWVRWMLGDTPDLERYLADMPAEGPFG